MSDVKSNRDVLESVNNPQKNFGFSKQSSLVKADQMLFASNHPEISFRKLLSKDILKGYDGFSSSDLTFRIGFQYLWLNILLTRKGVLYSTLVIRKILRHFSFQRYCEIKLRSIGSGNFPII